MTRPEDFRRLPVTQILGGHKRWQALDERTLLVLGEESGGVVEVVSSVGDTLVEGRVLLRVLGGRQLVEERPGRRRLGRAASTRLSRIQNTIPLLVDIAIRALSPAINDSPTAVQALDQIEDPLLRIGSRRLEIGVVRDRERALRVVIPHPTWEDFLTLAFDEIHFCGATNLQVMRRMKALIDDLISALPEERHESLRDHQKRLDSTIARSFSDPEEQQEAAVEDRQGLGVLRSH